MLKKIALILVSFVLLVFVFFFYRGITSADMEVPLGLDEQNKLAPCPDKPNCVSSMDQGEHFIAPIGVKEIDASKTKAIEFLKSQGAKIKTDNGLYLHALFKSALFRFVDDLELYFDVQNNQLHVRSASRVGHSDMGVNRKRVEALREFITK